MLMAMQSQQESIDNVVRRPALNSALLSHGRQARVHCRGVDRCALHDRLALPHGKGALEAAAAVIGASGGPNAVATETEPVSSSSGVDMVKVRGKL